MKRRNLVIVASFLLLLVLFASANASQWSEVIVQADNVETAAAAVYAYGGRVDETLGIINSVSAEMPRGALASLREDSRIVAVYVDHTMDAAGRGSGSRV